MTEAPRETTVNPTLNGALNSSAPSTLAKSIAAITVPPASTPSYTIQLPALLVLITACKSPVI